MGENCPERRSRECYFDPPLWVRLAKWTHPDDFAGYPSQPTRMRQRTTAGLLGRVPQWALKVGHFRCSATS